MLHMHRESVQRERILYVKKGRARNKPEKGSKHEQEETWTRVDAVVLTVCEIGLVPYRCIFSLNR
jgi:hypothetical protein